jgi:hypothetical protein
MEIFSFSKGFRLYKLLIKFESLLLSTPTFLLLLSKENMLMYGNNEPCWLRCIHILLKHLSMNHMLTHPENFKSRHIYSIKKKLQNSYEVSIYRGYLPSSP